MSKSLAAAFTLVLALFIVPNLCGAQSLATGTWSGYIIPPEGQKTDVNYEVAFENDSLSVSIVAPMGSLPISNIVVGEEGISFQWSPGVLLFCELALKESGGYEGECAPENGSTGTMVMIPPAKEE